MFLASSAQLASFGLRTANERRSVMTYDVQVTFDAELKQFSYSGVDVIHEDGHTLIPIAFGTQTINFTLFTQHPPEDFPGLEATFEFFPLEPDPGTPTQSVTNHSFDSTHCVLGIDNTNTLPCAPKLGFSMTVMYEGTPYKSPDPSIVNDPPG
jgi:hypothetical protein